MFIGCDDMNNLRLARIAKRMTQAEVANYIGLTQSSYSWWESGRTKIDSTSLARLAELFGVTTDYLLGVEQKKEPATISDDGLPDLDRELISMLCQLSPDDCRRVKDFVAGIESARRE